MSYQTKLVDIWKELFPNLIQNELEYTSSIDKCMMILNKIDPGNNYKRSSLVTIDKNDKIFFRMILYPDVYEKLYNVIMNMMRTEKLIKLME